MSEILTALEILQNKTWIDLTHSVNKDIPRFGSFPALEKETLYTVEKDGFFVDKVSFVTQYGTHIDAPVHFSVGKKTLDELDFKQFILPLFVINKEKEVEQNPDFILQVEHILEFEQQYGKISKGSFVAFATGWSRRWGDQQALENRDKTGIAHTPGWSIEALDFLINQRGISAVGHETLDTDAGVDVFKNKHLLSELFILEQNKFQVELLKDLTLLPATGGIIILGVPKFEGLAGFPVRAFAIIP